MLDLIKNIGKIGLASYIIYRRYRRKIEIANAEKWNDLWDKWAEGEVESPYKELMLYSSEVNNGGHFQYFDCIEDEKEIETLETLLPNKLSKNLRKAYQICKNIDEYDSTSACNVINECDMYFYKNEKQIDKLIMDYILEQNEEKINEKIL